MVKTTVKLGTSTKPTMLCSWGLEVKDSLLTVEKKMAVPMTAKNKPTKMETKNLEEDLMNSLRITNYVRIRKEQDNFTVFYENSKYKGWWSEMISGRTWKSLRFRLGEIKQ